MANLQHVETTYDPFSLEPEYIEANRGFAQRHPGESIHRLLDLACGTGTITRLLMEIDPSAHVNGVDLDPEQIQLITSRFRKLGYEVRHGFELTDEVVNGKPVLQFAEGRAEKVPFPSQSFDCVTICHAIHLMPDKEKFLQTVYRLLEPGGTLGFNTTFYAGAIPPGGNKLYFEWIRQAADYIEQNNQRLKAEGKPLVRRRRGTRQAAFQNRWLSVDEWSAQLSRAGFTDHDVNERYVEVGPRSFELIGAYGGLAEVLLSGYPVEAAAEALQACAKPAMESVGLTTVARKYLEVWTRKRHDG